MNNESRVDEEEFNSFNKLSVGSSGEEQYNYYIREILKIPSNDNCSVEWVNETKESGLPYDFIITIYDKIYHVDVKATKGKFSNTVYLSKNEKEFSELPGVNYVIARLSAGETDKGKATSGNFNVMMVDIPYLERVGILQQK